MLQIRVLRGHRDVREIGDLRVAPDMVSLDVLVLQARRVQLVQLVRQAL